MKVTTHYIAFWSSLIMSNLMANKIASGIMLFIGVGSLGLHYYVTRNE